MVEKQTSTSSVLQIAQIVPATRAEGPGNRFAVWFQGCPLRCPGCCNPEMLRFNGGKPTAIEDVLDQLMNASRTEDLEGISLLGGEPFSHAEGASMIAREAQTLELSVMIYSGFLLSELRAKSRHELSIGELLDHTDLLVDGPYEQSNPDNIRRWIGSTNQKLHFLSERYSEDDPQFTERDTMEIRLSNGELQVNGFPAQSAKDFWKRKSSS